MLKNKSFLKIMDFTKEELEYLLDLSQELKSAKKNRTEEKKLIGKNIALIFEKNSTRTRCAYEVAAFDQGANVSYIGPNVSHIGDKESIKDTAKVLGGFYDAIQYRGYGQEIVEDLSKYSGVPVWNGLTTEYHPTQTLADLLTIKEQKGYLKGIKLAYVGDGRNNVSNSLMIGAAKFGMDFRIATHKDLFPDENLVKLAQELAKKSGGKITITEDPNEGVEGCDVIYTDVWVSMGESKSIWEERIKKLKPYQVNGELVKKASKDYIFMHCLPAFHDLKTKMGEEMFEKFGLEEMEVTNEIFEGENSVVFDEAENRLHTIKAVMVATMAD
jgi:ornithine carbamoyltransferase